MVGGSLNLSALIQKIGLILFAGSTNPLSKLGQPHVPLQPPPSLNWAEAASAPAFLLSGVWGSGGVAPLDWCESGPATSQAEGPGSNAHPLGLSPPLCTMEGSPGDPRR